MVICEENLDKKELDLFNKILDCTLENIGQKYDKLSVNLCFVDEEQIRTINDKYRNVDRVTDVLSFPCFDEFCFQFNPDNCPFDVDRVTGEINLGDVFICRSVAEKQAKEYGHKLERELAFLFVHSCLHLLGYDHMEESDAKLMRDKEDEILGSLGIGRDYEF